MTLGLILRSLDPILLSVYYPLVKRRIFLESKCAQVTCWVNSGSLFNGLCWLSGPMLSSTVHKSPVLCPQPSQPSASPASYSLALPPWLTLALFRIFKCTKSPMLLCQLSFHFIPVPGFSSFKSRCLLGIHCDWTLTCFSSRWLYKNIGFAFCLQGTLPLSCRLLL